MPIIGLQPPKFKPLKEQVIQWDNWRKGLNLLLRENEVASDEAVSMTNLLLKGSGVPAKRWGTRNFFLSTPSATGYTGRFIKNIKDSSDNQQVLSLTDWGILTKKDGASYIPITGASWPSGSAVEGTQLGGNIYLLSADREMVRYDFSNLKTFPSIVTPDDITATNISGATVAYTWS